MEFLPNNTTEKAFSPIGCAINEKSYRFMTIWRLLDDCLTITWRLPYYCLTTAWYLTDDCLNPAWFVTKQVTLLLNYSKVDCSKWPQLLTIQTLQAFEAARSCVQTDHLRITIILTLLSYFFAEKWVRTGGNGRGQRCRRWLHQSRFTQSRRNWWKRS